MCKVQKWSIHSQLYILIQSLFLKIYMVDIVTYRLNDPCVGCVCFASECLGLSPASTSHLMWCSAAGSRWHLLPPGELGGVPGSGLGLYLPQPAPAWASGEGNSRWKSFFTTSLSFCLQMCKNTLLKNLEIKMTDKND